MKIKLFLLALSVGFLGSSFTSPDKPKAISNDHILIFGELVELGTDTEDILRYLDGHNVFVYQGQDLYVVFQSNKEGDFEFNLPTGHKYELAAFLSIPMQENFRKTASTLPK